MNKLPVYILAGGKSSRFGKDKARAELNGEPLIVHTARSVASVATSISLVADKEGKYDDLGFRTIGDIKPGLGPLGGLQTALADLKTGWLLLTSCDLIGIQTPWLETLLSAPRDGAKIVAFRGGEEWQPIPALYNAAIKSTIDANIEKSLLSLKRLLDTVEINPLPLPKDWFKAANINTPSDLKRLPPQIDPSLRSINDI
ncbi:MAG: molybdenum cofactor guanylyltransferase MobA [Myxococcota bacterium]